LGLSICTVFACKSRKFNSDSNSIGNKSKSELSLILLPTAALNIKSDQSKITISLRKSQNSHDGIDLSLAAKKIFTSLYCGYEINSDKETITTLSKVPFEWARLMSGVRAQYQRYSRNSMSRSGHWLSTIDQDFAYDSVPVLIKNRIGAPKLNSTLEKQDYDFLRSELETSAGLDPADSSFRSYTRWNSEIQTACPNVDVKSLKTLGIEQSEQRDKELNNIKKTIKMVHVPPALVSRCRETRKPLFHKGFREFSDFSLT
jgi:hypothetical protein